MNIFALISTFSLLAACSTGEAEGEKQPRKTFTLYDYYTNDGELNDRVDSLFDALTPEQRLSRMIITSAGELGKPRSTVVKLVKNELAGGVLFLKGKSTDHKTFIDSLTGISSLPLFFSIDAEPSLMVKRLPDVEFQFPDAADIEDSLHAYQIGNQIATIVKSLGFGWNYAPVVDMGIENEAVKTRSFGSDREDIISKARGFLAGTRAAGVIGCVKHFPGHGLVRGDTHKETVSLDGELTESKVYPPLIKSGVLSVMVAHVTVQNNEKYATGGVPSSCSRKIVTDLLRNEMGFRGIIITDAMNMAAAVNEGESAPLTAAKAGNDMILMPPNEEKLLKEMTALYRSDPELKAQWDASVKRILRLMICNNMLK